MKKTFSLAALFVMLILSASIFAESGKDKGKESEKNPFDKLWAAISDLQKQLQNISLTPGPAGPSGNDGAAGPAGPAGSDGLTGTAGPAGVCTCEISASYVQSLEARIAVLEASSGTGGNGGNGNQTSCTVGFGSCVRSGTMVNGVCDAIPGQPTPEVCDGIDNNCNGRVDEADTSAGPCGDSSLTCVNSACVRLALCGDGIIDPIEQCDDGNIGNGDGCSSTCQVETEWNCAGSPSICARACNNPPPNTCSDANTLLVYPSLGVSNQNGWCAYTPTPVPCDSQGWDECNGPGVCDPSIGACTFPTPMPNGWLCMNGDGECMSGICTPY